MKTEIIKFMIRNGFKELMGFKPPGFTSEKLHILILERNEVEKELEIMYLNNNEYIKETIPIPNIADQ